MNRPVDMGVSWDIRNASSVVAHHTIRVHVARTGRFWASWKLRLPHPGGYVVLATVSAGGRSAQGTAAFEITRPYGVLRIRSRGRDFKRKARRFRSTQPQEMWPLMGVSYYRHCTRDACRVSGVCVPGSPHVSP